MSVILKVAGSLTLWLLLWSGIAGAGSAKVYVADEEGDTVSVLDAASFSRVATIPVGREPHNIQVSPDGKLAWVTNNGERRKEEEPKHKGMAKREHEAMTSIGEVWAIDTATDTVVAKVSVGRHLAHVVLTPDGRLAYVTNGGESTVSVVDTEARKTLANIPVGRGPNGISLTP